MMDLNAQKEQFSLSYIRAIAAHAGFHVNESIVDRDSVDGFLISDFGRRPRIEFQAKATTRLLPRRGILNFPLPVKNYNDLRADTLAPRILIILLMPQEERQWVNQTDHELCLRHCAYWMSLEGLSDRPNSSSVTVQVPTANVFSSEQLADLMQKAEEGEAL